MKLKHPDQLSTFPKLSVSLGGVEQQDSFADRERELNAFLINNPIVQSRHHQIAGSHL